MSRKKRVRPRRIPERTCVACLGRRGKRELVRVARLPNGRVAVDETGKGPGRGAYVCRSKACWEFEDLPELLGRALKTTLTGDDRDVLAVFAANLPEDADRG